MAMIRCKANLHFYDADKNKDGCPYCRNIDDNVGGTEGVGETMGDIGKPQGSPASTAGDNSGSTIGDYPLGELGGPTIRYPGQEKEIFEPVVGWLVCTEGPNKGRDYRIKLGSNIISREEGRNIRIVISDPSITRSEHAEILFDNRDSVFYLVRKASSEVRLGDKLVLTSEILKAYDEIELGTSKFRFVPYCTGEIKW
jgi:hypothetical protein